MRRKVGSFTVLVALQLAVILSPFMFGCGASAREKTLSTTLTTVNASRDAFVAWDTAHQTTIVQTATSLEQGKATLAEYRTGVQTHVVELFSATYHAIAAAAIIKDDPSLAAMLAAVKELQDTIDSIRKAAP